MRLKKDILGDMPLPVFLLKCRNDPKFFFEKCLGVTEFGGIHPFQLKWIDLAKKHKRLIIEAPAGFSKTEVMGAMYPLWVMLREKDLKILLLSKTMEQSSSNLLSRIKKYIENNELLMELFSPDDYRTAWNATEIKTKNGHWVKNVPYSPNIRGYRANLIICDELDSYDDSNVFFEHVTSRLYPDGQLIGISTPVGATKIIGQLKEKTKANILKEYYFEVTTALIDEKGNNATIENQEDILKYQSIWPENWNIDRLFNRWSEQGKANWMRNYMCVCLGEIDDAIFPQRYLVASFDYNRGFSEEVNQNAMYFIGADFAISDGPRADYDAYVVIEKIGDQYITKSMEVHKGWQRPQKVNRLKELYEKYNSNMGTHLIVDSSNMGTMVMNDLRSVGVPVIEQKFHSAARTKLITTLGTVFSGKNIVIPRDPEDARCVELSELLMTQLMGFKRKISENTGNRDLIASRAPHDDLAMAFAMAVNEAVQHAEMECLPIS